MAWNFERIWTGPGPEPAPVGWHGITSATLSVPSAAPAAPGSVLVAFVAARPDGTAPPEHEYVYTMSDDLGGAWHQVEDANGDPLIVGDGTSTRLTMFARMDAGGVTSVTVSGDGGSDIASVTIAAAEFTGGPAGNVPVFVAAGGSLPNGDAWPPVQIDVPEGALVLASMSVGVTNREFVVSESFEVLSDFRASGRHQIAAYRVAPEAETAGPTWTKASGSTTGLNALTVAIVDVEQTGPVALTVNAGADRTVEQGNTVPLSGQASGGEGAKSFQWSVQSGPSGGVFDGGSASASVVFVPAGEGTYVLRCTVTDTSGTAFDDVTVTVEAPPPPDTVDFTGASGWTSVEGAATALAAVTDGDDATWVETGDDPDGEVLVLTLPPLTPPAQGLVVPLRLSATSGGQVAVLAELYSEGVSVSEPLEITVSGSSASTYTAYWSNDLLTSVDLSLGIEIRLTATKVE